MYGRKEGRQNAAANARYSTPHSAKNERSSAAESARKANFRAGTGGAAILFCPPSSEADGAAVLTSSPFSVSVRAPVRKPTSRARVAGLQET